MEPQKIEDVIKQRNYYQSQAQRLLKTINTLIALDLITDLHVANVEDLIDSVSQKN
jgi:prefoldin subunit 5